MGLGRGLRVAAQPGQTASLHLYLGTAEAEIAPYLRRLVRPGTVCVDIGGNNAYYALIFAQRSGMEVVTLDFDPDAIALGTTNLALNPRLGALVRQHRCYVAREIVPEHGADTLDHLLATGVIRPPGLLKIDVEGAEMSVLQGALQLLREHRGRDSRGRARDRRGGAPHGSRLPGPDRRPTPLAAPGPARGAQPLAHRRGRRASPRPLIHRKARTCSAVPRALLRCGEISGRTDR